MNESSSWGIATVEYEHGTLRKEELFREFRICEFGTQKVVLPSGILSRITTFTFIPWDTHLTRIASGSSDSAGLGRPCRHAGRHSIERPPKFGHRRGVLPRRARDHLSLLGGDDSILECDGWPSKRRPMSRRKPLGYRKISTLCQYRTGGQSSN